MEALLALPGPLLIWWAFGAVMGLSFIGWAIMRAPVRITIWLALMGWLVWWLWGTPFIAIMATLWPLTMAFLMLIPWAIFIPSLKRGAPDMRPEPQAQAQVQQYPFYDQCEQGCMWVAPNQLQPVDNCPQHGRA